MANGLTGQYDAVVQVTVEAVNRILATMHQNGVWNDPSPDAPPILLHRFTARVGESPKLPQYERASAFLQDLGANVEDIDVTSPESLSILQDLSEALQDVSEAVEAASSIIGLESLPWLTVVRGTAKVQVSTPTITFSPGATSEVTVHCQIRAQYRPDPITAALPDPIHGELRATFSVEVSPSISDGKLLLEVKPPADDAKIHFLPAPGTSLSTAETKQIVRQFGLFLRKKIEPINFELPKDFTFRQFKALGSGSAQAIALPLMLSTPHIPAFGLDSVTNKFLMLNDDFGIAISKEYVDSLLDPLVGKLQGFKDTFTVSAKVPFPPPWFFKTIHVSYHVAVSSVTTTWQAGKIILTVMGNATTSSVLPDYWFTITRAYKVTPTPDPATPMFSLEPDGDPGISGNLPGFAKKIVKEMIVNQESQPLAKVQGKIQAMLSGDTTLGSALQEFDPSAKLNYTAIEIQPDGLIVRGALRLSGRPSVFLDFAETPDGTAFTAFKSWIPGGTIEKYVWSWVSAGHSIFAWLDGDPHELPELHRFTMPRPNREDVPINNQVCLRVEGSQVDSGWVSEANEACQIDTPDWMTATMPSYWNWPLMLPVWGPDPAPDRVLDSGIVAHVNVAAEMNRRSDARVNTIVHFTDGPLLAAVQAIHEAISQTTHQNGPISVILVLPIGALKQMAVPIGGGSQPPAERSSTARELSTPIALTEDYEGGWSRAFGVQEAPATHVMNAQGALAWQHVGPLNPAALTAALGEHLIPGRRLRARLQRQGVRVGDLAPDLLFEYAEGRRMALRKLRGQRLLLNFWKGWSTPCLAELRRLQRAHDRAGGQELVILAIGDGENAQRIAEIRRELGLTFNLLPDPERRMTRRYRVDCWPMTVSIGKDGVVDRVHFGATPNEPVRTPAGRDSQVQG